MSSSYQFRMNSLFKDLNTEVRYCLSWVIGQNVCRQLATSSENLVASTQFLVALATSESQFRTLFNQLIPLCFKEARGSFFGLRVEVLKLQSRIQDKPRSPSYYIIISTYDQSSFSHRFPSNSYYHSNGSA